MSLSPTLVPTYPVFPFSASIFLCSAGLIFPKPDIRAEASNQLLKSFRVLSRLVRWTEEVAISSLGFTPYVPSLYNFSSSTESIEVVIRAPLRYAEKILSIGYFKKSHSKVFTLLSPFLENLYDGSGNTGS